MSYNRFNPAGSLKVALKRRGVIIAAIVASLLLSGIFAASKAIQPMYLSSCSIKFFSSGSEEGLINRLLSDSADEIETQQAIMVSHDFLIGVAAKLSLINSERSADDQKVNEVIEDLRARISIEGDDKTGILFIRAVDKEPDLAHKLAETLSSEFITGYREAHDRRLDEVISHIHEEQQATGDKLKAKEEELERFIRENRLVSIDLEGEALLTKKNKIEDEAGKSDTSPDKELKKVNENIDLHMDKKLELDGLKAEVESLRNIASFLEEKRQEAMIRKAERSDDVRITSPAQRAAQPFNKPDYLKILLTGLLAGIILGLILAIIIEAIDHSASLIDKLEKELKTRIMGIIPRVEPKDLSHDANSVQAGLPLERAVALVTHFAPRTLVSESFRGLRANIQAAIHDGKIKTIAVTGSYPGEGRSTVAANLSISLAQAGLKTLLVESDINNPDPGAGFCPDETPGLSDILLGTASWEEAVKTVTDMIIGGFTLAQVTATPGLDKLNIITRGAVSHKKGELLSTKGFSEFLDTVRDKYDIIILDSPPVLSSADAAILGAKADGVVIVYSPIQVSKGALKRTCIQLGRVSSNIMGIVLNSVRPALIPDALRKKYEAVDPGNSVVLPPVKKRGLSRLLIPIAAIIIIIVALWWQRDLIFPERTETKVTEVVKTPEKPVVVKPQKPDTPEVKPQEADMPGLKPPVGIPAEKVPAPVIAEQKQPDTAPAEPVAETETGLFYLEGRYPYSVYLGSFDSTDQARSALDKYLKAGITSFWVKVNLGEKGIWYRVYSGEFADKEGAGAFINEKAVKDGEIKKTAHAVYIGGFTDQKAVEEKINLLRENGYSPYIIADENYDNLLVGAFVTKAGAEELSAELNALGIANKVVFR